MWRMLKTPAVYTLETSLCGGAVDGEMPQFTPRDLKMLGEFFCLGILLQHDIPFDLEMNYGIPMISKS